MRPTANTSAGSTRGAGLAAAGIRAAKGLAQKGRDRDARRFGLLPKLGLLGSRAAEHDMSVSAGFSRAAPAAPVGFEGEACHPSQGPVSEAPAYDTGRLAPCSSRMTLLQLPGFLPGKTAQLSHLLAPFRASPRRRASGWNPEAAMGPVHQQGQASVERRHPSCASRSFQSRAKQMPCGTKTSGVGGALWAGAGPDCPFPGKSGAAAAVLEFKFLFFVRGAFLSPFSGQICPLVRTGLSPFHPGKGDDLVPLPPPLRGAPQASSVGR